MPWSNQSGGGGPWKGGGNNGGPWGSGGGGGNGNGPWGGGPNRGGGGTPPDLDELLKRTQDRMKTVLPGGGGGGLGVLGVLIIIGVVVAGWLFTGFYTVDARERGVELVLGEVKALTAPGWNYNFPYPIGEVYKPEVEIQRETTVGVEERVSSTGQVRVTEKPEESLMLTGDENIVDVGFKVLWRIKNSDAGITSYLFNVEDPDRTVKAVAESAMREVVGGSNIDAILTENRVSIQNDVATLMQTTLDDYRAGIEISEVQMQRVDPPAQVIDAFRDVQAARADQERIRNEAQAYANQVVPEARGAAAQVLERANAYKEQSIAEATGQSQRFTKIYEEYKNAPDVTRERLYLETLEKVLGSNNKIIIDSESSGSGVLPFLPLNDLNGRSSAPAARTGGN
ncbi:MAG: FtsH protease activity modulator HflK [Roseibium sp.]|uniref:FtsH protease activity modulator HflK n=1 Tax=Roseibium sp. TaxID=1936156 RepID=UPI001B10E2DD|nr:FtsH protease activity modulator HflK [Roseibium sp.]MBO6893500.1 FtsH protease activity modulator HflK [Roseibium sp.]MBO6931761.1 FtsH protease activity modulator HflK [Roseibium sp.]